MKLATLAKFHEHEARRLLDEKQAKKARKHSQRAREIRKAIKIRQELRSGAC
jgi:hypothetical protein